MAVMTNQEFLFSLAVHSASFGPPVEGRAQDADRQKLKFDALIVAIGEAEKIGTGTMPPHLPDGKAADATIEKLGVYSTGIAVMIVGTAIIPDIVLPDDGALPDEMRVHLETVLDRIFKVEGEGFDTNNDLLPYTWVIVPLKELCDGNLKVAGMGGATGG